MSSKQAKRTKRMCNYIWANVPELQLMYQQNFKKFYRQAKKDVQIGAVATLSRLYSQAAVNEAAEKGVIHE